MKTLLLLLALLVVIPSNKEAGYSSQGESMAPDTIKEGNPVAIEKADPIFIDPVMKQKVISAFELLKKYSSETKAVPKNALDKIINCWSGIVFGKSKTENGTIELQVEETTRPDNLVIFFEDVNMEYSDHSAKISYLGNGRYAVSIVSEFVKNNSVELNAGIILHELMHIEFLATHYLQGKAFEKQNELLSYSAQLYFLVYAYNGVEKELECFNGGKKVKTYIPTSDSTEFEFYFNKVNELRSAN